MAIIVNAYAGPGSGKSTLAAGVFFELKSAGVNCELVREYAKRKVWEGNTTVFKNQAYIFGKQSYEIMYTAEGVDVIITDSPILLSALYNKSEVLGEEFNELVLKLSDSYDNMNYFINRTKEYSPAGRHQDEEGARQVDKDTIALLTAYGVEYKIVDGNRQGMYQIVNDVLIRLGKNPLWYYDLSNATGGQMGFIIHYSKPSQDTGED